MCGVSGVPTLQVQLLLLSTLQSDGWMDECEAQVPQMTSSESSGNILGPSLNFQLCYWFEQIYCKKISILTGRNTLFCGRMSATVKDSLLGSSKWCHNWMLLRLEF